MARKMARELRLVGGYILDANAGFVAPRLEDTVDQQHRIAMRQQLQEALDVVTVDRALRRLVHNRLRAIGRACPVRRRASSPAAGTCAPTGRAVYPTRAGNESRQRRLPLRRR